MTLQIATTQKKEEQPEAAHRQFWDRILRSWTHTLNEEPQPHVLETFGLPNLKPAPIAPST